MIGQVSDIILKLDADFPSDIIKTKVVKATFFVSPSGNLISLQLM